MIRRLLIANRGEIAIRIMRGAREMGIECVAVYSDADRSAEHVRVSDRAAWIGGAPARESYLAVDRILDAAVRTGCDAIHPGYGFLAESADFAEACRSRGIVFVGPPPEAMRRLGDKRGARELAEALGLPVVPGGAVDAADREGALQRGRSIGFPLLVKASAGGGGKGMRRVDRFEDLADAMDAARREAEGAFGDGRLILERYLEPVRHVEIQILGEASGNVLHFGERDCSVQRRHQKIVEESPSPAVDPSLRARMGEAAIVIARAAGYRNAGTVEFMLDPDGRFYFLEVNTRLQVEHPVTEAVTGIDLVHLSLREAAGEPLGLEQGQIVLRGHAVEARIYAEDPENDFLPSPGTILLAREPVLPGVRIDSGIASGSEVSVHYDPILAKVIASHRDRPGALRRLAVALESTVILGVRTNLPFLQAVLAHPVVREGGATTRFVEQRFSGWRALAEAPGTALLAAAAAFEIDGSGSTAGVSAGTDPDPYSPWRRGGEGGGGQR